MTKTTWSLSGDYAVGFPASLLLGVQRRGVCVRSAEVLLDGSLLHTILGASSCCVSEALFTHGDHLVGATILVKLK